MSVADWAVFDGECTGPDDSEILLLVQAAQTGDRRAFADLHQRYAPMVHGVILGYVPYEDAADLVQEVFLTALKRLQSLRDRSAFGAWLVTIARNRATDVLRRTRQHIPLPLDLAHEESDGEEAEEILGVIRALPETYRETLIMRLVEDMSGPEIAERTGLTPGSVRVNLHRGFKLLREKLAMETGK